MSNASAALVIRELDSLAEFKRSEQLQRTVWGVDDPADNSDLMLAIQHEGGLVAGAFDGDRMLGFIFAFPSSKPHVQHSHRLAVLPECQGQGLGARMKWYQRSWCLTRGIRTVRWTFDPLRRANASLNISRLGAIASIYHADYYGAMPGINAGVPSDRIVAEWHLDTDRVRERQEGSNGSTTPAAGTDRRVSIPRDIGDLLANAREAAMTERLRVRGALTSAFEEGFRIVGFDSTSCDYVLDRSD